MRTQHHVEDLKESLETAKRFGPAVLSFSDVVRDSARDPDSYHVQAAGRILYEHATERLPKLAQGLQEFQENGGAFDLPGDYAPALLNDVVKRLPAGSTLWAATDVTSDWFAKSNDDVILHDLSKRVCALSAEKKLSVHRIYNFSRTRSVPDLRTHINRELKAGVEVRIMGEGDWVPDMALLWIPAKTIRPSEHRRVRASNEIFAEEKVTGLCGFVFDAEILAYLRSVTMVDPRSNKFAELQRLFDDAWTRAVPTHETKDAGALRSNRPDRRRRAA